MPFIHYSRLQTYHQLIGTYDLYDKYKFSNIKFTPLKTIKIFNHLSKFSNNHLSLLLFQEILVQKRFTINKMFEPNIKSVQLILQKLDLFNCLELLINSYFLRSKPSPLFFRFNSYISIVLDLSYNNEFFSHFNLKKDLLKYTLVLNFKEETTFLNSFLSYYFIKERNIN